MELVISAEDGDLVHVDVRGKITQDHVGVTGDPLMDLLGSDVYSRKVLFDLASTDFVDSSGVSWLLVLHKNFNEGTGCLILHSIPQMVMKVFKVLNMHLVFKIAENKRDAEQMASGSAS